MEGLPGAEGLPRRGHSCSPEGLYLGSFVPSVVGLVGGGRVTGGAALGRDYPRLEESSQESVVTLLTPEFLQLPSHQG